MDVSPLNDCVQSSGDCPQLPKVLRIVQEFFKKVEQTDSQWTETIKAATVTVKSLLDLASQLDCVGSIDLQSSPFASFPDVKQLLGHKIQIELEEEMDNLQQSIVLLKSLYTAIQKQANNAKTTYRKHSASLGVSIMLEATPIRPSLVDLLSWVDDVERHFKDEFLQRKIVVDTLDYHDVEACKELVKVWCSAPDRRHLTWILANVGFFLKDDVG